MVHLYRPGTSARTLLVCHGTGGDENSLAWLGEVLDPTANLLCPRGNVNEHGMPRFFRRFGEGIFDLEDVAVRAHELADFVAQAATDYGFDPSLVSGVGYSNGANILSQAMLLRSESLAAAVLFRAMVVLEEVPPLNLNGKRVFLSEGRRDPIVPEEHAERLRAQLAGFGAEVTLHWVAGGHELTRDEIAVAKEWLAR